MLTCIPVNTPLAHLDTALGERNMFQSLISADSPTYRVRQAKKGLLFTIMYGGHSQQEQQRTVPSGLIRPDYTHLVRKHTSSLSRACQISPWLLHSSTRTSASGHSGNLDWATWGHTLEAKLLTVRVGNWWVALPALKNVCSQVFRGT